MVGWLKGNCQLVNWYGVGYL